MLFVCVYLIPFLFAFFKGGVDLLLHLLSNVIHLPVTKAIVKDSGMGKVIGSIEKHSLVSGTPNVTAVKERVQQIKDAWNASVKAQKSKEVPGEAATGAKRQLESPAPSPSSAKRLKSVDDTKKASSFASLIKKVSSSAGNSNAKAAAAAAAAMSTAQESAVADDTKPNGAETKGKLATAPFAPFVRAVRDPSHIPFCEYHPTVRKKPPMSVKWADHFGGALSVSKTVEGAELVDTEQSGGPVSWSDRKKRDRIREKDLLAKARSVMFGPICASTIRLRF